ncbi:MAG: BatA domain-containing protein, partial [Verrucomicrobiales bacterium]
MLFIHIGLLAGLAAVAVPIAIHLWSQRRRQRVAWAAVRFLKRSVDVRKRKVEFEDALLMATRCLLVALVALAVARPFIPDSSRVPWALVLPMGIAAICGLGVTVAVWRNPSLRVIFLPITLVALLVCGGLLLFERNLNEKRLGAAGKQDIAILVDASMSMTAGVAPGGEGGNFAAALEEARALAGGAEGGDPMAVILAGTVPEELTAGLVRDRGAIDAGLGAARPTSGRMAALAAIENAVSLLEEGVQPG